MRQVLVITGIAAMLLLAACAGTPRHAPLQGIGAGRRQAEGSVNVCGRLPSVGMGTSPAWTARASSGCQCRLSAAPRTGPAASYLSRQALLVR